MRQQDPSRRAIRYLIGGIILLLLAYLTFITHQPVTVFNQQGHRIATSDLTVIFRVISVAALTSGVILLSTAMRGIRVEQRSGWPSFSLRRAPAKSWLWLILNLLLLILAVWTGYEEMAPARLQATNPDLIFCGAILILTPLVAVAAVHFSNRTPLRRASLMRSPFYWREPLQGLFITAWWMLGMFAGTFLRVHGSGDAGFWTVAMYGSLLCGLVIGQTIVYWVYRDRIGAS